MPLGGGTDRAHSVKGYPRREVIPLALSGVGVIGAAVAGAIVLVWILLRMEARDEAADDAAERAERERQ